LTLDSKEPDGSFQEFISGEIRYASLEKDFPDEAKKLHHKLEQECMERYEILKQMAFLIRRKTSNQHKTGTALDHCRQCGTCCRKGGPAIHREDKKLLENGHIPLRYLFTIRKNEPVYDNVQGCIISAPVRYYPNKEPGKFKYMCVF
jgi:hypothetical protein